MLDQSRYLTMIKPPAPSNGTMLIALAGHQDPTGSALRAAVIIGEGMGAATFAEIVPDEFYTYSPISPVTKINPDNGKTEIIWPGAGFSQTPEDQPPGPIIFIGQRPDLRLQALGDAVAHVAQMCQVTQVIQISSIQESIPHTLPPEIWGFSTSDSLADIMMVTGNGVPGQSMEDTAILAACLKNGLEFAVAATPTPAYIIANPNPMTAHHLARHITGALGIEIPLEESAKAAREARDNLEKNMEKDQYLRKCVEDMETQWKNRKNSLASMDNPNLVQELNEFLRTQAKSKPQE